MATYFFMWHLTDEERLRLKHLFDNKYEIISKCHIWKGAYTPSVYSVLRCSFRGKRLRLKAHHALYYLENKHAMSSKMHVSHLCHSKLCVNIKHLSYGPQSINKRKICAHEGSLCTWKCFQAVSCLQWCSHSQIYLPTVSNCSTLIFRLWYCLMWSQFNRENEWTPRTITRIQDIVSHRITQSHDTFQVRVWIQRNRILNLFLYTGHMPAETL